MSPINKLGPCSDSGKLVLHRFSAPCCGERLSIWRRLTSFGRKVKTWCPRCGSVVRVWVPKRIDPHHISR